MGAKSELLAKQFEAKVQEAMATLEKLGDKDWRRVTEAEKWSVGVRAHHLAGLQPLEVDEIQTALWRKLLANVGY